jgi:hypothetical protein
VGATLQQILYGMAYAHSRGWNYVGVVGVSDRTPHGFSTSRAARWLLGTSSIFLEFADLDDIKLRSNSYIEINVRDIRNEVPLIVGNINGTLVELKWYKSIPLDEVILKPFLDDESLCPCDNCTYQYMIEDKFHSSSPWKDCGITLNSYFTKEFLLHLRKGYACHLSATPLFHSFHPHKPNVALHIRRGDVTDKSNMYTPLSYYKQVLDVLFFYYPEAVVHGFSSSTDKFEFEELLHHNNNHRKIIMHLDQDPLSDWEHMVQADVFVMAKSTFSHVPALLNSRCVVYQHHWRAPLAEWMTLDRLGTELVNCLSGFGFEVTPNEEL